MRANSPGAFFVSITLHVVMAVAIALATILLTRRPEQTPPVIFELVRGEPIPGAERGPNDGDIEFNLPKQKSLPAPTPPPVRETIETPPAPQPKVVDTPPAPKAVEKKPEPKKTPPKEEKKTPAREPAKMSYDEFVKQHGKPQPKTTPKSTGKQTQVPRIDTNRITSASSGGRPTSGERGRAESRAEMDALNLYLANLRDRLRDAHDATKPAGLGDTVSAEVSFVLAANGEISNVRIVRSSGHPEFDQSVLEAFRRITWPGARPDRRTETMRLTFRMREQ